MMCVEASPEGLPVIVVKLEGVPVYLDNWAIIELANADPKRRERFVKALKSCGSLLFSFTNSIELGEAEGEPAERVRTFLDEIGTNWIPIELDPWTVMDREVTGQTNPTPCISTLFMETFAKDRMREQSAEGSKVVDLSPENFFKLTSVMRWANATKERIRRGCEEIDEALINLVADEYTKHQRNPSHLDEAIPNEPYLEDMPTRFALLHLLRLLVTEAKRFTLKKGDGRDFCHAALGAAYGSFAALDKHWKRRVEALPGPNEVARIYSRNELNQLVEDLVKAADEAESKNRARQKAG